MSKSAGRPRKRRESKLSVGLAGRCPCCVDLLPIKLCGLNTDVSNVHWTASEELIWSITVDLGSPDTLATNRAHCYRCKFKVFDRTHYWIQADPTPVGMRHLAGPYCFKCVEALVETLSGTDGRSVPPRIYSVTLDKRVCERIARTMDRTLSLVEGNADEDSGKWGGYALF
jgi:hypothetical protein